MKKEIVFLILMSLLLIGLAEANPIPVPTLLMPEEYIDASIFDSDGEVVAKVDGAYPFLNIEYENVTMYYPVPPDASNISVEIDGTSLYWTYNDTYYPTAIGDFPMIKWTISPTPENFTIKTHYEHTVPRISGYYTFLYAMGTGRYLKYWPGSPTKETTAYVNVTISKDITKNKEDIKVYTVGLNETTEEWTWHPANYTIAEDVNVWTISLTKTTEPFEPLEEDLLVTIAVGTTIYVEPSTTEILVGDFFTINVTLADVVDLYGYDIWLSYNKTLLDIIFVGAAHILPEPTIEITEADGIIRIYRIFSPPEPPISGSAKLISIIFNGTAPGSCILDLFDTQLVDPDLIEIPHKVTDGSVTVLQRTNLVGDTNADDRVDHKDLFLLAAAYGSEPGDPRWNPNCDIDGDGKVTFADLFALAAHYGKKLPPPPCDYVPGEIIVGFYDKVTLEEATALVESYNLTFESSYYFEVLKAGIVKVPVGEELKWVEIFTKEDIAKYAELNHIYHLC